MDLLYWPVFKRQKAKINEEIAITDKKTLQIIITVLTEFAPELVIILLCHKQLLKPTSKLQQQTNSMVQDLLSAVYS